AERPAAVAVLAMLVPVAALLVAPSPTRVLVTLLGVGVALVVPGPSVRRLGGITGDVLGATILLTETAVLVACALAGGLA
ncbi:MAG: adenosylcobinamide-GDP ribazoletransferase, partial [Actinomycetota bacterium]|nr:adenosylcobinamide-GDP ribazoletransferase [Actinomycetota bacterium]